MNFPFVHEEHLAFGGRSYSAFGEMAMPDDAPHVRGIEFRLPPLSSCPSVSCQLIPIGKAPPLGVYALKINENVAGQTQIAISAQTLDRMPTEGKYQCSLVAIVAASDKTRAGGGRIEKNATQTRVEISPPIAGRYAVVVTEVRNEENAGQSLFHMHVRTTAPDHFMLGHDPFTKPDPIEAPSYYWIAQPF